MPLLPFGNFFRKHGSSTPEGETIYAFKARKSYSDKFSGRDKSELEPTDMEKVSLQADLHRIHIHLDIRNT